MGHGQVEDERVVVFVDGSNFYRCLKQSQGTHRVDYLKLCKKLAGQRKLIRIYYYNAVVRREDGEERYQEQQRFLEMLRKVPYLELRLGRLEKRGDAVVQKGIDVQIATDMLRFAYGNAYDTGILISGDADFVPAVKAVKDLGKHVENAFVKRGQSRELRQTCDRFILLDANFIADCWLEPVSRKETEESY
jgi:uncharacterized LabA/DUF88 family protein